MLERWGRRGFSERSGIRTVFLGLVRESLVVGLVKFFFSGVWEDGALREWAVLGVFRGGCVSFVYNIELGI